MPVINKKQPAIGQSNYNNAEEEKQLFL